MPRRAFFVPVLCAAQLAAVASASTALADDPEPAPAPVLTSAAGTPVVNGQSVTAQTRPDSPAITFGARHQLAMSSDQSLTISNTSISGAAGSVTTISLEPVVDFFVIRNLSIGGGASFRYITSGGSHATSFGTGPRVGYNVGLSDLLSIWPKVGLGYTHTSSNAAGVLPGSTIGPGDNDALTLNLYAPLMFHPAQHFFAGVGPFLDTDLTGNAKATTFGAKMTIGGWLSLP